MMVLSILNMHLDNCVINRSRNFEGCVFIAEKITILAAIRPAVLLFSTFT